MKVNINQGGEIVWKIDGTLIPVQKSPYSIMSKLEMSGNFSLFHEWLMQRSTL